MVMVGMADWLRRWPVGGPIEPGSCRCCCCCCCCWGNWKAPPTTMLLLGELESIVVGHLALHLGEGLVGELLLGLDHAQVNVLLVRCSNLLLLLLKEFDLLGESELLHH